MSGEKELNGEWRGSVTGPNSQSIVPESLFSESSNESK